MKFIRFTDLCTQGRVSGQRVFIRADLNVPQDDAGHITEDTRIRASVPCIELALKAGAAWPTVALAASAAPPASDNARTWVGASCGHSESRSSCP